jgi:hypothetical protein
MRIKRLLLAPALVVVMAVSADAAVTVRTAPASPPGGGIAHCAVTNGGTNAANDITLTMFSFSDNFAIVANGGIAVGPNQTTTGSAVPTSFDASWCECIIPNKADFRCSFTVVNGGNVTVVPAR